MALNVTSPAFDAGGAIPPRYTCDDDNLSPPIAWEGKPAGTECLAVVCEDPDSTAGSFTHWVYYNIPPTVDGLGEGVPAGDVLTDGSRHGVNDFDYHGYGGPCPPPGRAHRYFFKVYALDTFLRLPSSAKKTDLLQSMKGHILAQGELMGIYRRM